MQAADAVQSAPRAQGPGRRGGQKRRAYGQAQYDGEQQHHEYGRQHGLHGDVRVLAPLRRTEQQQHLRQQHDGQRGGHHGRRDRARRHALAAGEARRRLPRSTSRLSASGTWVAPNPAPCSGPRCDAPHSLPRSRGLLGAFHGMCLTEVCISCPPTPQMLAVGGQSCVGMLRRGAAADRHMHSYGRGHSGCRRPCTAVPLLTVLRTHSVKCIAGHETIEPTLNSLEHPSSHKHRASVDCIQGRKAQAQTVAPTSRLRLLKGT